MKTIIYVNSRGIKLKINKFEDGQFKHSFRLTFSNAGIPSVCHTMTELRYILLENGMTRIWANNVKDRFDPLTESKITIDRYATENGSEMEVFNTSRGPYVNMVKTGLGMGFTTTTLLDHRISNYGFKLIF